MSIDLRTQSELKRIFLNSNGNEKDKPEPQELETEENVQVVAPAAKEVTASIADILASYNKGRVSFLPKASGNIPIPEGVSTRDVDGNTVTTFRHNDRIQTQIYGSDFDAKAIIDRFILKDIKYVLPQEPEATDESNGVNGEIDEKVEQGGTGDCWLLTGVLALNSTDIGKKIIKSSITSNANDNNIDIFKDNTGIGVEDTDGELQEYTDGNGENMLISNTPGVKSSKANSDGTVTDLNKDGSSTTWNNNVLCLGGSDKWAGGTLEYKNDYNEDGSYTQTQNYDNGESLKIAIDQNDNQTGYFKITAKGNYKAQAKQGETFMATLNRLGITNVDDIKAVQKANPKAFANKYFRVDVNDVYIPKEVIANMKANGTYDEDKLMGKTV